MTVKKLPDILDTSRFRIIDAHCHLGKNLNLDIQSGDEDGLVSQMDDVGVDKIAVSPMIGISFDCKLANDWTSRAIKKYPDRIIGMATINPNREDEILPELERCFDHLGMSMIKLHPYSSRCPLSRKCYELIYGFASERGLAIMSHDWESPDIMEALARRYKGVRFIQAHSAGAWDGHSEDDYFRVARENENAFLDICSSLSFYGSLEKLVDIVGADNLLFGTDAPFMNLSFAVGIVMMAEISDQDRQKIFADNFLRVIAPFR